MIALAIVALEWRRRAPVVRILCDLVFLGYLVGVVKVTLFPIITEPGFVAEMRAFNSLPDGINLVPIVSLKFGADDLSRQLFLNVLLGIPFGFGVPFLGARSVKSVLLFGLAFTLAIEGTQLMVDIAYGFAYRTVDINDVLLNLIGVAVGLGLFFLTRLMYQRLELSARDVGEYLHGVMAGFDPKPRPSDANTLT